MSDQGNAAFHAWLRTQFSTLDEAKAWVWRWMNEWHQMIPKSVSAEWGYENFDEGGFTMRAMAHHVSLALENREIPDGEWYRHTYMDSAHGSALYWAMGDKTRPVPKT